MVLAELIGDSPAIVTVRDLVGRLLRRPSISRRLPPLLLLGETGTGKGLLAHAAHRTASWRQGPFIAVNCAAIPESLVEAELFGFERGAFTDARQAKMGLIQAASGGTLFLDEVGLLPPMLQAKLLTVVEDRTVRRVGSTRGEPVDVWIVAATSVDLAEAVHAGRFREDLYHRLAVMSIVLPPLRERSTDVLLLAQRFLDLASVDYGLPPKVLSAEARAALLAYAWPGNVRELANVIERVMLLLDGEEVTAEDLALPSNAARYVPASGSAAPTATSLASPANGRGLRDDLDAFERDQLLRALEKSHWNVSRAAAQLGVPRNTLRYRIIRHGIEPASDEAVARRRPIRKAALPADRTPSNHPRIEVTAPADGLIPRAPRWETRSVVLLGVTLRAATADERARSSTVEVLEALVERTETFGGRVHSLGPHGAIAAFGLEAADEAPGRAALAALAIRRAAERLSAEDRLETAVALALHTGSFLVNAADDDTGPHLSMDARRDAEGTLEMLFGAAAPNTIVACPRTALLLERRFVLDPGPVVDHIGAVRHLVARDASNLGLGRRPIRPFVGRDPEWRHIQSVLEEVVGGPGRVVGIVGEPGIGKTRLLYEVKRSLIGKDLVWREGRCAPHGAGVPYLPVLDLLRDYCGIAEFDSTDVVLAAVNRALETARLDPLEGVPYLVRLLGMDVGSERCAGFTPDMVRAQAIEVLCELLIRSSHDRPLVVCVEDLQWIDRPSEEFLTSLVERLPGAPLLLIASYRPGYRPPWLGKSYAMQVTLAGLSMADSLKIIEGARTGSEGPLEGAVAEAIATRADGNPFFLEELARGLGTGGSTAVPTVPATIQDVLMERIVRVPEGPRRCLQVASVLGRSFALDHLEEIGDRPAEVAAHLNELRRLEFVHESHTGSGRTYRFKHALTQEVAYASLPPAERERLHGAAGRVLEQSCAGRLDEVAHQLAYHFTRSALSDKAVESLVRFAERAARCYAHAEAAAALQQALEYVRRWDDVTAQRRLAEIVLALGGSLYFLGRFRDIRDLLSRHRADVVARRDARLLGRYYFRLAHTADLLGDHAEAIDSAQRAVREAECAGDVTTRGQAHYVLTRQGFWAGDLDKANEHGREAIACLQTTPERWWLGMAHWAVGVNYTVLGKLPPALAAFAQAEAVGVEIRDQRLRSYAAFGTGWAHAAAGRGLAAIEACQRGVEHAPDPVNRNYASAFLGLAHLVNGDAPQAIALLEPVVRELARFEFRQPQGWHSAMLAEAYLATGTVDRARVTALEGLRLTTETGYRHGMGWARRVLGRIETASEKLEEAASHLQIAFELFNSIHAQIDVAQTRIDLAALAWRGGHSIQARAQLAQALKLWRALGVPRWIERSECLAAEWDRGCPESEAAFPTPQQPG